MIYIYIIHVSLYNNILYAYVYLAIWILSPTGAARDGGFPYTFIHTTLSSLRNRNLQSFGIINTLLATDTRN